QEFSWKGAILNAVVLTLLSWGVFVVGLSLTIPLWPTVFGAGQ
ncbi:MAG: tripartite tricarboxylate transporter TctB family protein, partial [Ideonella sp.]